MSGRLHPPKPLARRKCGRAETIEDAYKIERPRNFQDLGGPRLVVCAAGTVVCNPGFEIAPPKQPFVPAFDGVQDTRDGLASQRRLRQKAIDDFVACDQIGRISGFFAHQREGTSERRRGE